MMQLPGGRPGSPVGVTWQAIPGPDGPPGRAGHTATLADSGSIYVLGGRQGDAYFNDAWEFDTAAEAWRRLAAAAPFAPRAYHTATLVGGSRIWLIGGSNAVTVFADVHVLDTATGQWSSPSLEGQLARGTHAAALHPLRPTAILVFGGYGGQPGPGRRHGWLADLCVLHTEELRWEEMRAGGERPCSRGYHTLVAGSSDAVYLYGGKGEHGILKSNALSVYNCTTGEWRQPVVQGLAPAPRANHAAALVGGNLMIVHGGRSGTARLGDLFCLEVMASSVGEGAPGSLLVWHQLTDTNKDSTLAPAASFPGGRAAHTLTVHGHRLYLFSGYGGKGRTFSDLYMICNFPDLQAFGQVLPLQSSRPPIGRRKAAQPEPPHPAAEGWRSTKRLRACSATDAAAVLSASARKNTTGRPYRFAPGLAASAEEEENEEHNEEPDVHILVGRQAEVAATQWRPSREARSAVATGQVQDIHGAEVEGQAPEVQGQSDRGMVTDRGGKQRLRTPAHIQDEGGVANVGACVDQPPSERDGLRREVERLQVMVQRLIAEEEQLRISLRCAEEVSSADKATLRETKAALQALSSQLEQKRQEDGAQVDHLQALLAKSASELVSANQRAQLLADQAVRLEEESRSAQREQEAAVRAAEDALRREQARAQAAKVLAAQEAAASCEHRKAAEKLKAELAATQAVVCSLQESVDSITKQLERQNVEVDVVKQELAELHLLHAGVKAECGRLVIARDAAEAGTEQARRELKEVHENCESLRREVNEAREAELRAKLDAEQATGEVSRIQEQCEKLRKDVGEAQLAESLAKGEIQQLQESLRSAEQEAVKLRDEAERVWAWAREQEVANRKAEAEARACQEHAGLLRLAITRSLQGPPARPSR
eukprot:SM000143S00744  [mRNA]  locus=s143:362548:368810:+ [translate_table: standard]